MARKTLIQVRRDTAANWTSANPTLSAGEPGFETDTGKVKFGDGSTAWTSLAYVVTDAKMVTSDITTNDVSPSKHGFVPKAPNDTSKFLRGDGTWAAVGGVTTVIATDVFWDAKGDLAGGTGSDAASRLPVGSNGKILTAASGETTGMKWDSGYLGGMELVYRYTVAGSDKASIDTGADTADAGTNDWTNGDLLEIWLVGRTDETTRLSLVAFQFNNNTGSNYDYGANASSLVGTTPSTSDNVAQTSMLTGIAGASQAANVPGLVRISMPAYTNTTFYKTYEWQSGSIDTAAANANRQFSNGVAQLRTTSAITRVAVTPNTSAKKLVVGTQLLVYKRRNA